MTIPIGVFKVTEVQGQASSVLRLGDRIEFNDEQGQLKISVGTQNWALEFVDESSLFTGRIGPNDDYGFVACPSLALIQGRQRQVVKGLIYSRKSGGSDDVFDPGVYQAEEIDPELEPSA